MDIPSLTTLTSAAVTSPSTSIQKLVTTTGTKNGHTSDATEFVIETPVDIPTATESSSNEMQQSQLPRSNHQCSLDMSLWKFVESADDCRTASSNMNEYNEWDATGITVPTNITVDVIIPVHNASTTIRETIASAMNQIWLIDDDASSSSSSSSSKYNQLTNIQIHVCCYNDASTDDSWSILQELYTTYAAKQRQCYSTIVSPNSDNLHTVGTSTRHNDVVTMPTIGTTYQISTQLWISSSPPDCVARGPGHARNRAVQMRDTIILPQTKQSSVSNNAPSEQHQFLCWLDSDDIMHPTRVYYQVHAMMQLAPSIRLRTLLGTNFDRFIATTGTHEDTTTADTTITPHYTNWANALSHERLWFEKFREVTIIQPTWMICRSRFVNVLHGYLVCPIQRSSDPCEIDDTTVTDVSSNVICSNQGLFSKWIRNISSDQSAFAFDGISTPHHVIHELSKRKPWRLVHPELETLTTIRVAEDLRFFHEHVYYDGLLRRTIASQPLVSYRHRPGISQSALTSRKLLLALRVASWEQLILSIPDQTNSSNTTNSSHNKSWTGKFIIWGAGRDGKDFFKALSPEGRQRVYCFVDVDDAKIARGFYIYMNPTCLDGSKKKKSMDIPIVHFSLAAKDCTKRSKLYESWKMNNESSSDSTVIPHFGRVVKNQDSNRAIDVSKSALQPPPSKRIKVDKIDPGSKILDLTLLPKLPVVVCVAMYRTNGALESNVKLIDRIEGLDLWHFS